MSDSKILDSEIARMKRLFHLKLARKRGLTVNEEDLLNVTAYSDDTAIQEYCERISKIEQTADQYLGHGIVRDLFAFTVRYTPRLFRK